MNVLVGDARVAPVAKLLADDSRAAMCTALLDGRFRTAGELARAAGVVASTASEHLALLVSGGLLESLRQGRHRYFRLASSEVAEALEALAFLSPVTQVTSLRQSQATDALRAARTCYDHLAGHLGVELGAALIRRRILTADFGVGDLSLLEEMAVELPPRGSRPFARPCLDWTERRFHAAGALPAALLRRLFALGWLESAAVPRAVRVTASGWRGLKDQFGIDRDAD